MLWVVKKMKGIKMEQLLSWQKQSSSCNVVAGIVLIVLGLLQVRSMCFMSANRCSCKWDYRQIKKNIIICWDEAFIFSLNRLTVLASIWLQDLSSFLQNSAWDQLRWNQHGLAKELSSVCWEWSVVRPASNMELFQLKISECSTQWRLWAWNRV